jgi:hypothetical protein
MPLTSNDSMGDGAPSPMRSAKSMPVRAMTSSLSELAWAALSLASSISALSLVSISFCAR